MSSSGFCHPDPWLNKIYGREYNLTRPSFILSVTYVKGGINMTRWHDFIEKDGKPPAWPYPINYDREQEIETDVLVIGGGIAGGWAAISAARTGVQVALGGKGGTLRRGGGGPARGH